METTSFYSCDFGLLRLTCNDFAVTRLERVFERDRDEVSNELSKYALLQLDEYFKGRRRGFDLPLYQNGSEFRLRVWKALCDIPYGETKSYGEIAAEIGSPKASRAVGMANNSNKLCIFVPCHRVIGKSGALVGYGGGLDMKEYLLNLEKRYKI